MALRRIAGRVPAAQLRSKWASLLSTYQQFGVAIPSGVEIAYHQTDLAIKRLHEMADGDRDQDSVCVQIDACDAYTRTSRLALIEACGEHRESNKQTNKQTARPLGHPMCNCRMLRLCGRGVGKSAWIWLVYFTARSAASRPSQTACAR